jgi:hypothetical protein
MDIKKKGVYSINEQETVGTAMSKKELDFLTSSPGV